MCDCNDPHAKALVDESRRNAGLGPATTDSSHVLLWPRAHAIDAFAGSAPSVSEAIEQTGPERGVLVVALAEGWRGYGIASARLSVG